jgi:hypothetical protein
MNLIIAGSRSITNEIIVNAIIKKYISTVYAPFGVTIISGLAMGVDTIGLNYAKDNGIDYLEYPANWIRHGNSAGYIRNAEMANVSSNLLAFWDQYSDGTKHMIDIADDKGMVVIQINMVDINLLIKKLGTDRVIEMIERELI